MISARYWKLATAVLALFAPFPASAEHVVHLDVLPSGHSVIAARLNGRGPFRFLMDTGSPVTILNESTARAAGVIGPNDSFGFLSVFTKNILTTVHEFEVCGLVTVDNPVVILNHPALGMLSRPGLEIGGIAGIPLLSQYALDLDYRGNRVRLSPNHFKLNDILSKPMEAPPPPVPFAASGVWGFSIAQKSDTAAGIVVAAVTTGSAVHKAGLLKGDRILALGGRWTDSAEEFYRAAAQVKPGTETRVKVLRGERMLELCAACRPGL